MSSIRSSHADLHPDAFRRWTSALSTVGIFLTWLFVPEPLRVPLAELDRRYAYHTAGKVYHGAFDDVDPLPEPVLFLCLLLVRLSIIIVQPQSKACQDMRR